jgi:hypothetical protein
MNWRQISAVTLQLSVAPYSQNEDDDVRDRGPALERTRIRSATTYVYR